MSIEIIKGSAGTGKTHQIIALVKQDPTHYIVCAPTHKALKVLSKKFKKQNITVNSGTIQSSFYQYTPTGKTKTVLNPIFDLQTKKQKTNSDGELVFNEVEEPEFSTEFSVGRLLSKYNLDDCNPKECSDDEFWDVNPDYTPIDERIETFDFSKYTIIVDEASMLTSEMWYELLKSNINIIFCGDDKQLAPIESEYLSMQSYVKNSPKILDNIVNGNYTPTEQLAKANDLEARVNDYTAYISLIEPYLEFFQKAKPTKLLTKIWRQQSDSDILSIASTVYKTNKIPYPYNNPNSDVICEEVYKEQDFINRMDILLQSDIVLAYTKKVCGYLNTHIRAVKFKNEFKKIAPHKHCLPLVKDKLYIDQKYEVIDYTNEKPVLVKTLTKGTIVEITSINSIDSLNNIMYVDCLDDNELYEQIPINLNFTLPKKLRKRGPAPKNINVMFGYALTTHKAQGSEFNSVCVVDENHYYCSREWLYTAVTRAAKVLYCLKWKGLKNV